MELDEQNPLPWMKIRSIRSDLPAAHRLTESLKSASKTTESFRFRGHDGHWHPSTSPLNLVLLDQHTTAGM